MNRFATTLISIFCSLSIMAHNGTYKDLNILKTMTGNDKIAILMVHFGSSYADARQSTLDLINRDVSTHFNDIEVFEAYSSRIIINILKKQGIEKQNPIELLKQLHKHGYTHIIVQPTTVINGTEMEALTKNVASVKNLFKDIRLANSLLYAPKDYKNLIQIITKDNIDSTAYVWAGHGTYNSATAQYAMLEHMFRAEGYNNCFVGTIDGYPNFDNVVTQLKASNYKNVTICPLFMLSGDHMRNDIAGDWKQKLENRGYNVSVSFKALGNFSDVRQMIVASIEFNMEHKKMDIVDKKNKYENIK